MDSASNYEESEQLRKVVERYGRGVIRMSHTSSGYERSITLQRRVGIAAVAAVGAGFLLSYVLGMIPALKEYVPTYLMSMSGLLTKSNMPEDFYPAVGVTLVLAGIGAAVVTMGFNRKEL